MKYTLRCFMLTLSCLHLHASDSGQATHLEQETQSLTPSSSRSASPSPLRDRTQQELDEAYILHLEDLLFHIPPCPRASTPNSLPSRSSNNSPVLTAQEESYLHQSARRPDKKPYVPAHASHSEQIIIMPNKQTIETTLLKYPLFSGCKTATEQFAAMIAFKVMTLPQAIATMQDTFTHLADPRGNDYLYNRFQQAVVELDFMRTQSDNPTA